jgi:hypothetical protein
MLIDPVALPSEQNRYLGCIQHTRRRSGACRDHEAALCKNICERLCHRTDVA